MTNEDGTLHLMVNGEIYNHVELRRRLEGRHSFRSRSDSEVIELGIFLSGGLDSSAIAALPRPRAASTPSRSWARAPSPMETPRPPIRSPSTSPLKAFA